MHEGAPHQPFDNSRVAWWRRSHLMLNAISCIVTKHMLILYKEELGKSTTTYHEPYLAPKTITLDKVVPEEDGPIQQACDCSMSIL